MAEISSKKLEQVYWPGIQQPRGRVFEDFRFERVERNDGLPCPSYRLTIDEKWEDETPLARITATTLSDEGGQRFVANHPRWSRDPRPFILWQIHEALWSTKILPAGYGKPTTFDFIAHAPRQDALTVVRLTAEVFYDGGGGALAMLANYANRHIFRILEEITAANPNAHPNVRELFETRDQFYRDRADAQLESKKQQEIALRNRPRDGSPSTLFIDESGDLGFRTAGHQYISCGVLIPDSRVEAARASIRRIVAKNWSGKAPDELHFTRIDEKKRARIASSLSEVILHGGATGVCYASSNISFCRYLLRGEAEHKRLEDHPIRTNIADLLNDPVSNPGQKLLILTTEEMISHHGVDCLLGGGNLSIVHDRKHRPWMNQALERGFERSKISIAATAQELYGTPLCPSMSFATVASETEPCLWLSDWIAWEVNAWTRGTNFSKGFQRVRDRMRFVGFDERGKKTQFREPGGSVVGHFPDRPREIQSII